MKLPRFLYIFISIIFTILWGIFIVYAGNNFDRINPTIGILARFGDGLVTPDTLLEQEGTSSPGTPNIRNIGSFLAGTGRITLNLTDSRTTSFTDSAIWTNHNGISGIGELFVNVCQTKTYNGTRLNPNCSNPTNSILYQISLITTTPYDSTGALFAPNIWKIDIDLDDTSGVQKAGEYQVYVAVTDQAGNLNTDSAVFNIIPEGFDPDETELIKYNNATDETSASIIYTKHSFGGFLGPATNIPAYANAEDSYSYKINIFDRYRNPIYNRNLYDFKLTQTGIYLDEVNKTGTSALFVDVIGGIVSNSGQDIITNSDGSLKFKIISYTPGEFVEQFQFLYKKWNRYGNEIPTRTYSQIFPGMIFDADVEKYNHIITGIIDLYTTNRIDLGTSNDVGLSFFTTSTKIISGLQTFFVSNFLESIRSSDPDNFIITNTGSSYSHIYRFFTNYPNPVKILGATGSFIPEQKGTIFTKNLEIITHPYVRYTFSGQTTQYYISSMEDVFGSGIMYGSGFLNRIFIEGLTSMVGKNGYVAMKDNLNFNSADMRNAIYKNIAVLLRNREVSSGGGIINRVKYLTGNVNSTDLTDMDQWDTLIIKGGNLMIGRIYANGPSDPSFGLRNYYFNTGTTSLDDVPHKGIIVLKDESGTGGNIFIKPDVRFIGATLFADESIESVTYNGRIFPSSNSARTVFLDKQLVIYGSIFSKNTVGGAVRANNNGGYILPWKNATVLLDDAVRYDLAFLRMNNTGYDTSLSMNRGHSEYVVVLSDPRNIANTLPGFTK